MDAFCMTRHPIASHPLLLNLAPNGCHGSTGVSLDAVNGQACGAMGLRIIDEGIWTLQMMGNPRHG